MAPTQTSTQLAVSPEALELSVPVQTLSAVSNGRESEPSAWLAAHAAGRRWSESWMRAIRTSSSMRGRWKRATTQRACALLYQSPRMLWDVSILLPSFCPVPLFSSHSVRRYLRLFLLDKSWGVPPSCSVENKWPDGKSQTRRSGRLPDPSSIKSVGGSSWALSS